MKIFNINKNNKGVTLIELMIAVALIGILTSIIVTTARFSETQKNLNLAKGELQAVLRLAQSYSLSIPKTGRDNICGFGVEVDGGKKYNVFYTYESAGGDCDSDPLGASSYEVRDVVGIQADEITVAGPDVFFRAPYGDVYGSGGTFTLSSTKVAGPPVEVTVSTLGQIN